ncbi:MAG: fluoride efflux transporter CrcB [Pirellulaceae bacterium]
MKLRIVYKRTKGSALNWLLVGIGGAVGACFRYGIYLSLNAEGRFPSATLIANCVGCFLIGLLFGCGWFQAEPWRLLVGVGFLGALTTFSTFGFETIALVEAAKWKWLVWYMAGNLIGGIALVAIGQQIGKGLITNV